MLIWLTAVGAFVLGFLAGCWWAGAAWVDTKERKQMWIREGR